MKNDINCFIKKINQIPENKWRYCHESTRGAKDIFGHLNITPNKVSPRAKRFLKLCGIDDPFSQVIYWAAINDGEGDSIRFGKTPKTRILNFLHAIKNAYSEAA